MLLGTAGCTATSSDETGMVTWYAVNPGGALRIVLYDTVCDRRYGSIRLSRRSETRMSTCVDQDGQAHVRYRPHGYASRQEGWTYNTIRADQRVYMQ